MTDVSVFDSGADRGVSALIGFLVVFTVVIGGALVVSTLGVSVLVDSGGSHPRTLAQGNFERLDDGFSALESGAPYRELRLDPVDASLSYGDSFTVRISARGGGVDLTGAKTVEATGNALRYGLHGGGSLSYVGGLVAYEQANGSRPVLKAAPAVRAQGSRLVVVLALPRQSSRSPTLVSGAGSTSVVLDRSAVAVLERTATDSDEELSGTITVEGDAATAEWRVYFRDSTVFSPADLDGDGDREYAADTDGDGAADVAGGSFTTEQLYVRTVTAGVTLGETL